MAPKGEDGHCGRSIDRRSRSRLGRPFRAGDRHECLSQLLTLKAGRGVNVFTLPPCRGGFANIALRDMTSRSEKDRKPPLHRLPTYWERTQWPLQCFYFLLPLLIAYEIGTVVYAPSGSGRLPAILAESLLGRFFEWLGVTGVYLPGLLVMVSLISWHLLRRDPWVPEPKLYAGMLIESILLTTPLLVLNLVISRELPALALPASLHDAWPLTALAAGLDGFSWPAQMTLSIGAGIYEELLFRLIAIALLHFILVDVFALPSKWGAALAVVIAALMFAVYHPFETYVPWHWSNADINRFVFYTLAGLYFAGVYVLRGFGIVVAVHALYDAVVLSLRHLEG